MTSPLLENRPLFQLNLMIWLSWYPLRYGISDIKPIFREFGFELQAISPSFSVQPHIGSRASVAGLEINSSACPDLLLKNIQKKVFLPIECKINSFGTESSNKKQAYVFLSTSGKQIASSLGLLNSDEWTSHVMYSVFDDAHIQMIETLNMLSNDLEDAKISSNTSGAIGISISTDRVYIQALPDTLDAFNTSGWIEVMNIEVGQDPTPLSLIPLDPTIEMKDSLGIETLERKLRAAIVASIGSSLDDDEFIINERDVILKAIPVWDFWYDKQAKKAILKPIRRYINKLLQEMRKSGIKTSYAGGSISISNVTSESATKIRKYMTTVAFRSGRIDWSQDGQIGFEDLSDDWIL
ncbi:MAG: hypothetical protein K8L99_26270 [Anaerolineae bacterium]|nr:hypothetical protein [Anaerolineae bacterium]